MNKKQVDERTGVLPTHLTSFPMIDVLRGFAAISVVIYHTIEHFGWKEFPTQGGLVWFRIGWMGVDLFFVISGFVITLSALNRLDGRELAIFRSQFVQQRLIRILPLHYLTCLVFIIFIVPDFLFVNGFWAHMASHLFFLHNLFLEHWGSINGVNWSIGTEMQFYLLILFIAPWIAHTHWCVISLTGVFLAWVWRGTAFMLVDTSGTWGNFPLVVASTQLPGMLDEFAIGALLAKLIRSERGGELLSNMRWKSWILPLVAAAMLWVMLTVYWRNASFWNSLIMVTTFRTLMAVSWALCVLAAVILSSKHLLVRFTAPVRYLGTISYGIYLWHLPVILSLKRVTWLSAPDALPYVVTLTIILAMISWHCFERPLLQRFAISGNRSL